MRFCQLTRTICCFIKNTSGNSFGSQLNRGDRGIAPFIINENNNCPDSYLAEKIINNMRYSGILVSTDGPFHNVIKIKPPMPFNKNNVDFFIEIFEQNISKI